MHVNTSAAPRGVQAPGNLLYAFIISRHGQRTPIMCCKNLPKNVPEDHGQLTKAGREQTFKLGQCLRARYKGFLEAGKRDQLLATHTRIQRCRESMNETVRGLAVPTVTPPEVDPTRYDLLFQASLIENIDAVLQAPGQEKREKFLVMDSLMTYVSIGNPIPVWAKPIWNDLIAADRKIFGLALSGNELWYAANVLGRVEETLAQKFEKGVQRPDRMHVFSMSDSSVYSTLKLLNHSYDDHPGFCASVFFEVFEDSSKVKRVQVLSTVAEEAPQLVAMDKLKNPCELKEFLDFLRAILKN
ncbi:hypothetical protein HPB49_020959 [Dermacentor silvarum]|uniref:Uncharacterized protein n=1 Tax=Dermacentor silvarum TaxID=543639 RepID=A0ACB8CBC0_DERSI|nr:hypothetical protein HPB49_020959 [Dermacentor silvarum]